jgi:uncharacterized protein (TIGR03067 family)
MNRSICLVLMAAITAAGAQTDTAEEDGARIQGTWVRIYVDVEGKKSIDGKKKPAEAITLVIKGDKFGDEKYKLDPTKTPKHIDLATRDDKGNRTTLPGIYELKGDKLKVCFPFPFEGKFDKIERPKQFGSKRGENAVLEVYKRQIPDKLVVLTFDDASKSHFTIARPLLKKHKFGATFFVTEGFDMTTNKRDYMTWEEIAQLYKDGFEIGNHTRDHNGITAKNALDIVAQVRALNERFKAHAIPAPVSFAYPGNSLSKNALPILKDLGIKFARRGGSPEFPYKEGRGFAFEPGRDHPLLVPSAGDARPDWTLDDFKRAIAQAKHGKIAVLQFHGVPDTAHNWVTTSKEQFEGYLKYLADNAFRVIAMRDLSRYVDAEVVPANPWEVIEERQRQLAADPR